MILTFDPAGLTSGYECVEFLKNKGISVSQKLGARILALATRRIQISPVVLEDAFPGSLLESFFLDQSLVTEDGMCDPRSIENMAGLKKLPVAAIKEQDIVKIVSPLELEKLEECASPGLPVLARSTQEFLGINSLSPHSLLSDRRFLEEMTLNFLDSEDQKVIVESLRKLTRIILLSRKDPGNLFREAFAKDDPQIWIASASIIREMINYDLGAHLESFLRESDSEKKRNAFRIVLQDGESNPGTFLGEAALQILTKLLREHEFFPLFSDHQKSIADLLKKYPLHIEEFIKSIFIKYYEYSHEELRALRDFLRRIAGEHHITASLLLEELQKNNPGHYKIIVSWILSPLDLDPAQEKSIIDIIKKLLLENIRDPSLLNMIKTTLLKRAPASLAELSNVQYYGVLDTENRLFIIELWEQYVSSAGEIPKNIDDLLDLLVLELNGIDVTMQRSLLRLKALQNPGILARLKSRSFNQTSLLEAAAYTFSSYQNIEDSLYLFTILQELSQDPTGLCFELIKKKHFLDEEISDYIPFIAHLTGFSSSHQSLRQELLEEVIQFLNTLSREKSSYGALAIEALGTIYWKVPWSKSKVSLFVKRVIKSTNMAFDVRVRSLRNLFLSTNLTSKTRLAIEDFFLERLRLKDMRSPELTLLLEEINTILNSGLSIAKSDVLIDIFGREIAYKLTQPTISEMMQSEAQQLGPSRFMGEYEKNPWKWEDISETLFILLKLYSEKKSTNTRKQKILHIISYLVHHWSLSSARKEKSSRFFLQDAVLFRILRDIIGSAGIEHSAFIVRIVTAVLTLIIKGNEQLMMSEDLQYFMMGSCRILKDEAIREVAMDFPLDIQRETIRYLLKSYQGGSKSAGDLLAASLKEDWLKSENRRLLKNYF